MPAPETMPLYASRPTLGHVNLMVDTFVANVQVDDLRSIVRDLLASGIPNIGSTFTAAARERMRHSAATITFPQVLFIQDSHDETAATPTSQLRAVLLQTRCLYGAGLGFASLGLLADIVRSTIGLRWTNQGEMDKALIEIDTDISQAIQSAKEETESSQLDNRLIAVETVKTLRKVLRDSQEDVESWGGEFPFERAAASVEYWKL